MELTKQEIQLRWVLRLSAVIFCAETLVYLLPALIDESPGWGQLPFVINSFLKAGLIGGVCFVAAADVRRFERAVSLIVVGLALWVPAGILILWLGDTSAEVDILGIENIPMSAIVAGGVVFEGALALFYAILHRRAFRAWHEVSYLTAGQFRTLSSVAEALLWTSPPGAPPTPPSELPPRELSPDLVAQRADQYLAAFKAKRKFLMRWALVGINLYPLRFGKPAFTLLGLDERREFLERHFGDDVVDRRIGRLVRRYVQGAIRLAQQVVYLGFYSDPHTWPAVGYEPFSQRPEGRRAVRKPPGELVVESALDLEGDVEAPIVVVGSGAAGAVIAYRLVEQGKDVLVVERGSHVDPHDFSEDEVEMLTTLYRDGAVQLARDFHLQVLQGMCVGGTTVVNNAVSIPPPAEVLAGWEQSTGGRLDPDRVNAAVDSIRTLLDINTQPASVFSRGVQKFIEGVENEGLGNVARRYSPIDANIVKCLGCGYCNIGCAYGRKMSMLDTLLPWAQTRLPGTLRIISDATAEGIEMAGGRVTSIHCSADGHRLRVKGDRFVVAAGPINSSYLLQRSKIGGPRVGEALSFNVGSPVTAEFEGDRNRPETLMRSFAGLQITHVFEPPAGGPDVVMETWFNPVVSQAMAMPGWFEDHRRNMLAYDRLAATGVLIGSESNGRVTKALLAGGADIDYVPTGADLARLIEGIKLAGRIYFAAGAKRVMPSTFRFHEFTDREQLDELDRIVRSNEDIQLGTGHPQGGNSLAADPARGPVDPRGFRVHGTENLHLCDASVFPTSLGVNPQLTTMALAECAAADILEALG